MAEYIYMPKLGLTMTDGYIEKWEKKEGETVSIDDVLFVIENNKTVEEIQSKMDGVLRKILVESKTVPVGTPVGIIGAADEDISSLLLPQTDVASRNEEEPKKQPLETQTVSSHTKEARPKISPKAKKIAAELGVPIDEVVGSGPQGSITEADIRHYTPERSVKISPAAKIIAEELGIDANTIQKEGRVMKADVMDVYNAKRGDEKSESAEERIPMSPMRRAIAKKMKESVETSPCVTYNVVTDTSALKRLRDNAKDGEKMSYTAIILKLVATALMEYPFLNCSVDGNTIIKHNYVNMGVAVAVKEGLVVPVIKGIQDKSFKSISAELRSLSGKARSGELVTDEMTGGTFTVTNLGMYGINTFSPIINQPEVAILGLNEIKDTPIVINGKAEIKPMMYLSLSADHRVVDGAVAAQFLARVKCLIEDPALLLMS